MAFWNSKSEEAKKTDIILPEHIGIIMDGNGRWAKKRSLPRSVGHREGAKTFRKITRYCSDIGIKYLTVYAFSTENWKRPEDEVSALMKLFKSYLNEALEDFKDDSIVVKFIGDKSHFSLDLQNLMIENEESSKDRDGMVLDITTTIASAHVKMNAINARPINDGNCLTSITITVNNKEHLDAVIRLLNKIDGVYLIERSDQ